MLASTCFNMNFANMHTLSNQLEQHTYRNIIKITFYVAFFNVQYNQSSCYFHN